MSLAQLTELVIYGGMNKMRVLEMEFGCKTHVQLKQEYNLDSSSIISSSISKKFSRILEQLIQIKEQYNLSLMKNSHRSNRI